METKNDNQVEVEESLDLPTQVEGKEDTTDWKVEAETLREKAIRQREKTAELKRLNKELAEKLKGFEPQEKATANQVKSGELDKGDKALLVAYGVKGADEIALAQSIMKRTGIDDVDALISDDIFQARLAKLRETKATQNAMPKGQSRNSSQSENPIDFNLAKYERGEIKLSEMPFEIRSKVLEKALENKEKASKFSFKS